MVSGQAQSRWSKRDGCPWVMPLWLKRPLGPRGRAVLDGLVYALIGSACLAIAWPDIPSEFREIQGVVREVKTRNHVYVHLASGEYVFFLHGKRRLRELPRGEMVRFTVVATPQEGFSGRYDGVAARCGETVYYSEAQYWAMHRFYKYAAALALVAGSVALAYIVMRRLRASTRAAQPPDGSDSGEAGKGNASGDE